MTPPNIAHGVSPAGGGVLFWPGTSVLHRAGVGVKLFALLAASSTLVWLGNVWLAGAVVGAVALVLVALRVPRRRIARLTRPILVGVAVIVAVQVVIGRTEAGVAAGARVLAVAALALLFTLTTSPRAIAGWVERALARVGVRSDRVFRGGLAVGLAVRSVDHLGVVAGGVLDARRARGLGRSARAFAVPMVVGAGRYANGVGEALDARGLADPGSSPATTALDLPRLGPLDVDGLGASAVWSSPAAVPATFALEALAGAAGGLLAASDGPGRHRWLLAGVEQATLAHAVVTRGMTVAVEVEQRSARGARVRGRVTQDGREVATALLLMVPFAIPAVGPAGPGDSA